MCSHSIALIAFALTATTRATIASRADSSVRVPYGKALRGVANVVQNQDNSEKQPQRSHKKFLFPHTDDVYWTVHLETIISNDDDDDDDDDDSMHEQSESKSKAQKDEGEMHGSEHDRRSHQQEEDFPFPPEATTTVPLHAANGTHHVYVYVGSPPQRQVVIVDTGSRLMAFPCRPCVDCGHHASFTYYDPAESTTNVALNCGQCQFDGLSNCQSNKCQFTQRYTEGSSLTAYEMEDLVWLGTSRLEESIDRYMSILAVPFTFGCQTSETGLFQTQYADGIMGMAMHDKSLLTSFYHSGAISRRAFSLCLTKVGGFLAIGGVSSSGVGVGGFPLRDVAAESKEWKWTPMKRHHGWYSVTVTALHVGHVLVTLDPRVLEALNAEKGTIIDSGTTDTYLPQALFHPFVTAWEKLTKRKFSNRIEGFTYEEFQALPVLTLTLQNDVVWRIPPESYMEAVLISTPAATTPTPGLEQDSSSSSSVSSSSSPPHSPPDTVFVSTLFPPLQQQQRKAHSSDKTTTAAESSYSHKQRRRLSSMTTTDAEEEWQGLRQFTNRIYLDEGKGCVLGGNAMLNHEILFDMEQKVVGISSRTDCSL